MDKNIISQRILQIQEEISKLSSTLYAMNNSDIFKYPDNYEILSTDAALRSETITCRLRHLLYSSTNLKKPKYLISAGIVQDIQIEQKNEIFEITLPCLLPKRKQKQSAEFLIDPVYFTLSNYADTHNMPRFHHCVICFTHVYNRNLNIKRIRDYDNLELKQLLDVITTFVMEDDTGYLCDIYNTIDFGDNDCTRISIMEKNQYIKWLVELEKRRKSMSNF